jgi:hypothetical protein
MTSAHANPADWAAAAAEVAPGHSVTVHPAGRPALRLVTPADWARGELWQTFITRVPAAALDPGAGLATGREAPDVYAMVLQDVGLDIGPATLRALDLAREIDRILGELYEALGDGAELVPVVPQLRGELVRRARAEALGVVQEAGGPAEWLEAAAGEAERLHEYPAGRR